MTRYQTHSRMSAYLPLQALLCLALLLGIAAGAAAQSASKLLKEGDQAFGRKDYRSAIEAYRAGLAGKPGKYKARYRLGFSYMATKQPEQAVPHLRRVHRETKKFNPQLFYLLGQAYHHSLKFDSAMFFYREFRDQLDPQDFEGLEPIEKNIDECRTGKILIASPIAVKQENLGQNINSPFADFVPVVTADEQLLIFTSRRPGNTGSRLAPDGQPFEDIYMAEKENGVWQQARNMGAPINTERHDACVALSADGKKLYLYKDINGGDIYVSERLGPDTWSTPVSMGPNINTPHYEPSISISDDGEYAFFSSNRPGGYGGLDLYVSLRQPDGTWGEPINLGGSINTHYDEDAPFIHSATNTLYFSSRGHKTMGGHDIFRTTTDGLTWSIPRNMGYPINSATDDIHFIVPSDRNFAYYSTVKPEGLGRQDIYRLVFPRSADDTVAVEETQVVLGESEVEKTYAALPRAVMMGRVTDAGTKRPVHVQITITDYNFNQWVTEVRTDSLTGNYRVELPVGHTFGVSVNNPAFVFYSDQVVMPRQAPEAPIAKNIALTRAAVGANVVLRNLYFPTNSDEIEAAAYAELDQLFEWLLAHPSIKVEISGHTDNTGEQEYNLDLSQRRARSVVNYLASLGINRDRLKAAGYGAQQPIATNATEEGRQKNRRTEFKIIEN